MHKTSTSTVRFLAGTLFMGSLVVGGCDQGLGEEPSTAPPDDRNERDSSGSIDPEIGDDGELPPDGEESPGSTQESLEDLDVEIARFEDDNGSEVTFLSDPSRGELGILLRGSLDHPPMIAATFQAEHSPAELFMALAGEEQPVPHELAATDPGVVEMDSPGVRSRLRFANTKALEREVEEWATQIEETRGSCSNWDMERARTAFFGLNSSRNCMTTAQGAFDFYDSLFYEDGSRKETCEGISCPYEHYVLGGPAQRHPSACAHGGLTCEGVRQDIAQVGTYRRTWRGNYYSQVNNAMQANWVVYSCSGQGQDVRVRFLADGSVRKTVYLANNEYVSHKRYLNGLALAPSTQITSSAFRGVWAQVHNPPWGPHTYDSADYRIEVNGNSDSGDAAMICSEYYRGETAVFQYTGGFCGKPPLCTTEVGCYDGIHQ